MSDQNEIVGHKTFSTGAIGPHGFPALRHEPLTRAEADAILKACDDAERKRATDMPTEQDAVNALWAAQQRLKELGWKEAEYAPADGKLRKTVSLGSSGIHDAYCERRDTHPLSSPSTEKWWWHPSEGDLWPHKPIYFKPDDEQSGPGQRSDGK